MTTITNNNNYINNNNNVNVNNRENYDTVINNKKFFNIT